MYVLGPDVPHRSLVHPTQHTDLAATFIDLANAQQHAPMAELDGMSFAPLLFSEAGNSTPWRGHSIQQFHENCNTWLSLRQANSTHTSSYRMWCTNQSEFFDLIADPFELNNIAGDPEARHPGEFSEMKRLLVGLSRCKGETCRHPLPWRGAGQPPYPACYLGLCTHAPKLGLCGHYATKEPQLCINGSADATPGTGSGDAVDVSGPPKEENQLLRRTPFLMTHEAGTSLMRRGDRNYDAARRSQSIGIADQLSCGARALDLRLVATVGSSFTQARLWSGDLKPDDEPDPANCTHCWVSNASQTLESVVRELKGWCKAHPDELVLVVTSHCRSRDNNDTLDDWHKADCTLDSGDLWVPAFEELGVNTISSCPRAAQDDPTFEEAKKQARANGHTDSCVLVVPGEGECVMANYDSDVTTIPDVKEYVEDTMSHFCPDGVYQGLWQTQALCQGESVATCPQDELNGNISAWLADGEFWHRCAGAAGYPVNVLGAKDICSLGAGFASALYSNASARVTPNDKAVCEAKCGQRRQVPATVAGPSPPSQAAFLEVTVEVGTAVVARTDAEFLSYNIDAFELVAPRSNSTTPFEWNSTRLAARARHLTPAKLRIGGGNQGDVVYNEAFLSNAWPAILNLGRDSGMDLVWGMAPSLSSASRLLAHPRSSEVSEWEFGNEPAPSKCCDGRDKCGCVATGCCISAAELGRQFVQFSELLNRSLGGATGRAPRLVGPDVGYGAWWPPPSPGTPAGEWLQEFLTTAGGVLSAATIHIYPFDHEDVGGARVYPLDQGGDPACLPATASHWCNASRVLWPGPGEMPHLHTAEDFTTPFAALVRRLAPHASLRIGETAAVDLSGVAGVTDSFVHGFWATQQYGWLARSGYAVVHRQVLACSSVASAACHYGVLSNSPAFEPAPEFWWGVLFKRLMGTSVLDVNATVAGEPAGTGGISTVVRTFAHCNRQHDGGVALMWANPQRVPAKVTTALRGEREEFHLSAGAGLEGNVVRLNGQVLTLDGDELPPLAGQRRAATDALVLAPMSYGFVVWAQAGVQACAGGSV